MHKLIKGLLYTAPVFAACLVLYFAVSERFHYQYQVESVRFEKQFDQIAGLKPDKYLKIQEKQLQEAKKKADKAEKQARSLQNELNLDLEDNVTTAENKK